MDQEEYLALLRIFIGHSAKLQNNPPVKIPQEDLICDATIEYLKDVTEPIGPLKVRKFTYVEGRSNLMILLPASNPTKEVVSFVGAHMDVVPANIEEWTRNPFELQIEGDKLFGRGVTDCLGHVAMLAHLMKKVALAKTPVKTNVVVVFIASEEGGGPGTGVDMMVKHGELDFLKNGPFYWVDSANFGPTMATAGMIQWELTATGKLFHSGFPDKAINPITMGTQAIEYIQKRFYQTFPKSDKDTLYKFANGSTMKPTQIKCPVGSLNQIPLTCTICGDIRLNPFYDFKDVLPAVERFVAEINEDPNGKLDHWGYESYELKEEKRVGTVALKWVSEPARGVAVDLLSKGYLALEKAIQTVHPEAKAFSITGTLPLVGELKEEGFDLQICGFGDLAAYHAVNEYALLSHLSKGFEICAHILGSFNCM